MIKPQAISWFYENLPEYQLIEDNYKEVIKKNYDMSGFVSIDTPAIERIEVLVSKWADDNEIYGIHRIHDEESKEASLWLRFDLTVPLARYVAQYEWELNFPFKRQHIGRVYRWERPQKGRYREFYQADIDIIWNWTLPLFADVEIISTIHNSLKELSFWDFNININNKKLLVWFLESIWIEDIVKTISIIDKKDKVKTIVPMLEDLWVSEKQINDILSFIRTWEEKTSEDILKYFSDIDNETLKEWLEELEYVYKNLLTLGVETKSIKINPSISRGLNYYTGTVFETFISWAESMWSVSSWGRYENLAENFTKNNFPWVWGSIWLSRLLSVLKELWKLQVSKKTPTKVLVVNMDEKFLLDYLSILKTLRWNSISTEIYLDSNTKMQKQLKYANNKNIEYVIIFWEDEKSKGIVVVKDLKNWEQKEVKIEALKKEKFN